MRERYFYLPVLWRVYQKKGTKKSATHRTKWQLAAEMVLVLATHFPMQKIMVVGDCA